VEREVLLEREVRVVLANGVAPGARDGDRSVVRKRLIVWTAAVNLTNRLSAPLGWLSKMAVDSAEKFEPNHF